MTYHTLRCGSLLIAFVLLCGCQNARQEYLATSESYIATAKGLVSARTNGLIDDDTWTVIKAVDKTFNEAMDVWSARIDAGDLLKPSDVVDSLRSLVGIYVTIYGSSPQ